MLEKNHRETMGLSIVFLSSPGEGTRKPDLGEEPNLEEAQITAIYVPEAPTEDEPSPDYALRVFVDSTLQRRKVCVTV